MQKLKDKINKLPTEKQHMAALWAVGTLKYQIDGVNIDFLLNNLMKERDTTKTLRKLMDISNRLSNDQYQSLVEILDNYVARENGEPEPFAVRGY